MLQQLVTQLPAIAMRHLLLFALILGFAVGCSKKKPPEPTEPAEVESKKDSPADALAKDRAYWLNALKSKDAKAKQEAADELVVWVNTDPETVTALLELMKDKTTTGAGKVLPTRVNSTRELAASVLNRAGEKGQAALKEKGLATLREGMADPDPAIREHSAHTAGTLGALARPLAPDILKLCANPDPSLHRTAFDALRAVGGVDPVELSALLASENREVVRLAAEYMTTLGAMPAEAVPNLVAGLRSKNAAVRTSCAAALVAAGPKAAPALDDLVKAINAHYPKEVDLMVAYEPGAELAYWRALAAIGEPAVAPVAGLLSHTNPHARLAAAATLGDIGEPSKAAADKLRAALKDDFGTVAIEAACTLIRIDESKDDAVALVKRAMDAPNNVAQTAIESIPRMGEAGKSLVPAAIAKLSSENPYARYAAIGVVGTLEPEEAAKHAAAVGKLAADTGAGAGTPELELRGTRQIRQRVGAVLTQLGPAGAPAAEALVKAIPNERDAGIRSQYIDALLVMGPAAKVGFPTLLAVAEDPSTPSERRVQLFEALAATAPETKGLSAGLLKTATEVGSPARLTAIGILAKLDPMPPEVLAKLVEMATTDRSTPVRVAALRALGTAGPRATPVRADIEKIAAGTIPEFALAAKVALAAMDGKPESVAGDVRAALADKNAQVRLAAVDALLIVGQTAADLPALQKLLAERGDATKEAAAKCVGRIGPAARDAVPQLVRLLDDKESAVRIAAATALGDIGPGARDAVEKLRAMRGTAKSGDVLAGPAAARALAKIVVREK